jgi:hypothetical protein
MVPSVDNSEETIQRPVTRDCVKVSYIYWYRVHYFTVLSFHNRLVATMASIRSLPQRESHSMASPSSVPSPDRKKKSNGSPGRWSRTIRISLQAGFILAASTVLYVGVGKQQSKMSSHTTERIQRKNLSSSGLRAASEDKPTPQCK